MNTTKRRAGLAIGIAAISLLAAACGSDDDEAGGTTTAADGAGTSAGATVAPSDLEATLNASGATFPKVYYEEVIFAFTDKNDGVTINYAGGGSGKGRQDLADQIVDWAGSDSPIKEEDKAGYKGGEVLLFPSVVAPITVSVNLEGAEGLQLDCPVIAKIFQREITDWSDAAIKALNPDLDASGPITPAVRSDSSGTTDNFSKFLDAACGSKGDGTWKLKTGSTIEWPTGVSAGQGNGGVAQIVKDTTGAIGYVDLSDAKASGLTFASVKNKAGQFVEPTLDAASAAADGATINPDLTFSAVWADGAEAYPITAQTWILAYKNQSDKAKGEALKAFIAYVLSDEGQALAEEVDFGALPTALVDQARTQLDQLQIPA